MQRNIHGRKALGLPAFIQRIMTDTAAVEGNAVGSAVRFALETHVILQPAVQTPAIIIVASGAFGGKILPLFKAIYIKAPHKIAYITVIFKKLAISHLLLFPFRAKLILV